jgi:hypothetical protein
MNDQLKLGRSILRGDVLPPARTRRWLKPWTHTSSLTVALGAPWEIYRLPGLTADGRVVDVYVKGGDIANHHSALVLLPDYGLVVSILTALPQPYENLVEELRDELQELLLADLVPAADAVARQQAAAAYAGVYASSESPPRSYVRLAVDRGPGLRATEMRVRGVDLVVNASVAAALASSGIDVQGVRLYPAGLASGGAEGNATRAGCVATSCPSAASAGLRVSFRASERRELSRRRATARDTCRGNWAHDRDVYGGADVYEIVFTLGADGRATRLESRGYRLVLDKVASSDD